MKSSRKRGNKNDMSADSDEGQLAAAVPSEYMRDFQERNPNLRVFSADPEQILPGWKQGGSAGIKRPPLKVQII